MACLGVCMLVLVELGAVFRDQLEDGFGKSVFSDLSIDFFCVDQVFDVLDSGAEQHSIEDLAGNIYFEFISFDFCLGSSL